MSGCVIDARFGVKQAFNHAGFWRMAIAELLDNLPVMQAHIECAFTEKNFEELRWSAHKLFGMALLCGTPMLLHALRVLEYACVERPNEVEGGLNGCCLE